ncbi:hypothetical protein TL16_g10105, partial [Triparma laevis f. inornata]
LQSFPKPELRSEHVSEGFVDSLYQPRPSPHLHILVISTTGQGELNPDTSSIKPWLYSPHRVLPETTLWSVYAIGDKKYGDDYCKAGRIFYGKLMKCGGTRVGELGFGEGLKDSLTWLKKTLEGRLEFGEGSGRFEGRPSPYVVSECVEASTASPPPPSEFNDFSIVSNTRITPSDHWQDVRLISLTGSCSYKSGDVFRVLPKNSDEDVQAFLNVAGFDSSSFEGVWRVEVVSEFYCEGWGSNFTFMDLLKSKADLGYTGVTVETMRSLAGFVDVGEEGGEKHRKKLRSFCETESGYSLFKEYVRREKRSIIDVLADFDTVKLNSLDDVLRILTPIQPREYSIASAGQSKTIQLLVAFKEGTTAYGRNYIGLASKFWRAAAINDVVKGTTRAGSFEKVVECEKPAIFIGAGTGVAPLRSVIVGRARPNDDRLVFGCRNAEADYYFKDEWAASGIKVDVRCSRDQVRRIYVQDFVEKEGREIIAAHILGGGGVAIAGGASMAAAVQKEILEILGERIEGGKDMAKRLLNSLKRKGTFVVEAWT